MLDCKERDPLKNINLTFNEKMVCRVRAEKSCRLNMTVRLTPKRTLSCKTRTKRLNCLVITGKDANVLMF